jgi:hypothetical protein
MRITYSDILRVTYYSVKEKTCQGFLYDFHDDTIALTTRTGWFQILGG